MKISASTNLYCIFGNPVKHSLSPIMHNNAFRKLDLDNVYLAFQPENIESAVSAMRNLNIKGASVTIPFKTDVINYLDKIDPLAEKIGAVNTLVNDNNKLIGYNTDGLGAYKSILDVKPDINNNNVLIIGNGGSARAIAFTLLDNNCKIYLSGRKSKAHLDLFHDLKNNYEKVELVETCKLTQNELNEIEIIINTTPLGMKTGDELPLNTDLIKKDHIVFDIVYAPHNTKLLKKSQERDATVIYGIEMLIHQGAAQFELWTGKKAPINVIREAINSELNNG